MDLKPNKQKIVIAIISAILFFLLYGRDSYRYTRGSLWFYFGGVPGMILLAIIPLCILFIIGYIFMSLWQKRIYLILSALSTKSSMKWMFIFMATSFLIIGYIVKYSYLEASYFTVLFSFPGVIILLFPSAVYNYFFSGQFIAMSQNMFLWGIMTIIFYSFFGAVVGYFFSTKIQKTRHKI